MIETAGVSLMTTTTLSHTSEAFSQRLTTVEDQVRELGKVVARLAEDHEGCRPASPSVDDRPVLRVRQITEEMFVGPVDLEIESDPSDPGFEYVVLTVRRSGDPKKLVLDHELWDEKVAEALKDYPHPVRLMIYPD
ncbi:MAG TPA: hypothetical protein VML55_24295 [Planctomycetaceae bacterium]|nr:hypothetical protein [Planctomycetaceae bacterium]